MVKAEKAVQAPEESEGVTCATPGLGTDLVCLGKAGVHRTMVNEGYAKWKRLERLQG